MIKNLIWDLDGTLFDTYPAFTQAFSSAIARYGFSADPAEIYNLARQGLAHCSTHLAFQYSIDDEELMRVFQEEYSLIAYEKQEFIPHALDLCRWITGKSGCNTIVTHRGRQSTLALLRAHDVEYLFRDLITGDDGFPRKPDPGGIEEIIYRNELDKDNSLVIGDRYIDVVAGKLAGIRTCFLGHDDRVVDATYYLSNLNELKQIISSENFE